MTTLPQTTRREPNAKTTVGRKRQRIHMLARDLNLCDDAYRNILYSLTGDRYARNLSIDQCNTVIDFMRGALSERMAAGHPVDDDAAVLTVLA